MDKNEHSIFAYVMDQLDENGIYQGGALMIRLRHYHGH